MATFAQMITKAFLVMRKDDLKLGSRHQPGMARLRMNSGRLRDADWQFSELARSLLRVRNAFQSGPRSGVMQWTCEHKLSVPARADSGPTKLRASENLPPEQAVHQPAGESGGRFWAHRTARRRRPADGACGRGGIRW